jgi:hypothetical protein
MPPHCWAHLGFSSGEKKLGSSIVIINCPALSAAIGGRDGVDASSAY